jgi:hypothetical protein
VFLCCILLDIHAFCYSLLPDMAQHDYGVHHDKTTCAERQSHPITLVMNITHCFPPEFIMVWSIVKVNFLCRLFLFWIGLQHFASQLQNAVTV